MLELACFSGKMTGSTYLLDKGLSFLVEDIMGRKKVFTTGQVAKICNVTTQTVTKWIDTERLAGYRIPGSKARRVTRENLQKFVEDHSVPTDYFAREKHGVLVVSRTEALAGEVTAALGDAAEFVVNSTADLLSAGLLIASAQPDVVLIDTDDFQTDINGPVAILASLESLDATKFIAVSGVPGGSSGRQARRKIGAEIRAGFVDIGFNAVVLRPLDIPVFLKVLRRMVGLE